MTQAGPYSCFDLSIEDHVAHIRLSRPEKLNAMSRAFWSELPTLVRDIDENARARVIVISSTGKHFCAGMTSTCSATTARWQAGIATGS